MLVPRNQTVQDGEAEGQTVFCMKCGKEVPDDSQFCLKCGHTLVAGQTVTPTPVPKQTTSVGKLIGIVLLLAILAFIGWQVFVLLNTSPHAPGTPTALQSLLYHNETIVDSTATLKPLTYSYFKIVVPANALQVSADGHFSAAGGIGNDVEVFIFAEDSFANFQNGHPTPAIYSSLRATQGGINAVLPSGAGTYYLVLSNKFSIISSKNVQVTAMLHYMY
jgi:hypothetical protein